MTANGTEEQRKLQRKQLGRVIGYHNRRHRAKLTLKGTTAEIIENSPDIGWVCTDKKAGAEFILVTREITDPELVRRDKIISAVVGKVIDELAHKLPGTFYLYIDLPRGYYFPFDDEASQEKLKQALVDSIFAIAIRTREGRVEDLETLVAGELGMSLPEHFHLTLNKIGEQGDRLGAHTGYNVITHRLTERELKEIEALVCKTHEQLASFKGKPIILVLTEGELQFTSPDLLAEAFKQASRDCFSGLTHIYYSSGKLIAEVALQTG